MVEQDIDHGRHRKVPVMRWVFTMWKNLSASKALVHDEGAALHQHRRDDGAGCMGDRGHGEETHFLRQSHSASSIITMVDVDAVGMDDALGLAGGAAGIDQDADVVGRGLGLQPARLEGGGGAEDVLAMREGTEAVKGPQAGQPGLERGGALGEGVGIDEKRGDAESSSR